jgi:hypothetical protein
MAVSVWDRKISLLSVAFLLFGSIASSAPRKPGTARAVTGDVDPNTTLSGPAAPLFSMNWNHVDASHFPSVPFGGIRLWDTHTSWQEIETSSGSYNWTMLDTWLSEAAANGKDVLYTFGRTPQWASARPEESCAYGNNGCAAPPLDVDSGDTTWKAFVTALVQHSLASPTAHIKYYELWNEPSRVPSWSGSFAQMVTMATDAYHIIHTLDPNALVVSPSPTGLAPQNWLGPYLSAGGSHSLDIVAFHAYVGPDPSKVLAITDALRSTMSANGIGDKPLWVTEGSWGQNTTMNNSQQVAYLTQEYLYLWSKGVARYYWYSWDSGAWGTLWDSTNGVHPAGIAYRSLYSWLQGSLSTSSPCLQSSDETWFCTLTLSSGYPAEIVWNATQSKSLSVDPAFLSFQTVGSDTANSIVGNAVTIGSTPVLLIQGQAVASTATARQSVLFQVCPLSASHQVSIAN